MRPPSSLRSYRRRARVARLAFAARLGSAALRPEAATRARVLTGAVTFTGGRVLRVVAVRVFVWHLIRVFAVCRVAACEALRLTGAGAFAAAAGLWARWAR